MEVDDGIIDALIAFLIFLVISIVFMIVMFFIMAFAAGLVFEGKGGDYGFPIIIATGMIITGSLISGGALFKFKK